MSNINFTFNCGYNPPIGEVNFAFPDNPCAAIGIFEAYTGQYSGDLIIVSEDWLFSFYSGESSLNFDLEVFRPLTLNSAITGETAESFDLDIHPAIDLGVVNNYADENIDAILFRTPHFGGRGYCDESGSFDLDIHPAIDLGVVNNYADQNVFAILKLRNYQALIADDSPSAYWPLNDNTGNPVDYFGNYNASVNGSGTTWNNTSPYASGKAYCLNGSGYLSSSLIVTSNNLTQECWVKPSITIHLYSETSDSIDGVYSQNYAIWARQGGSGSGVGISVGTNGVAAVAHGDGYMPCLLVYATTIPSNTFTHIVVTWNNRYPTLYINGVSVRTGIYQARNPMASQGLPNDGYGNFRGCIHDVAIYPSTLTAQQVLDHYTFGRWGFAFTSNFDAYSGQNVDASLYVSTFTDFRFYSGETNDTVLSFYPAAYFDADGYSGETFDSTLSLNVQIYPDEYTGETLELDLQISPAIELGIISNETGEILDSDLSINPAIELGIVSHYTGQTLDSSLTFSVLLPSNFYFGQNVDATVLRNVQFTISTYYGESGLFNLDIHPAIDLGVVNNYTGQLSETTLSLERWFLVNFYGGQILTPTLTIFPSIEISLTFYSGETGYIDIQLGITFPSNFLHGQRLFLDSLSYIVNLGMELPSYSGQEALLNLSTTNHFSITGYHGQVELIYVSTSQALYAAGYNGQYLIADVTDNPVDKISPTGYFGQLLNTLSLTISQGLSSIGYSGSTLLSVLTSNPPDLLDVYLYYGQNSFAILANYQQFFPTAYKGEILSFDLSINPPDLFTITGYSGQCLEQLTFVNERRFTFGCYTGESLLSEFTIKLGERLSIASYFGGNFYFNHMQTSEQFPLARGYSDQVLSFIGVLNNEPHWYLISGETAEASINPQYSLPIQCLTGSNASFSLTQIPAIPIQILAYSGQTATIARFGSWKPAEFQVVFSTSIGVQVDIDSTTYFDLTTDVCCPPRDDGELIFIEGGSHPSDTYYGNRTFMSVGLTCYPRFKFRAYTGTYAKILPDINLSFDFAISPTSLLIEWETTYYRLCKGNFIPNGSWITTELSIPISEDCKTNRIYYGETLSCDMGAYYRFDPEIIRVGTKLDLYVYTAIGEILYPRGYSGQIANLLSLRTEVKFDLRCYTGQSLISTLYTPPPQAIPAYSGQNCTASLVVEFVLGFIEKGCLDNEFEPTSNDDSDAIIEPTAAVEGRPYIHDLKIRCF
jgi:hypothetical protein